MSMAEPRRRRKWTLNPRGTLWANDDNKYGQKLMEKMGWSKGSGLGREEQGIKEHLTVKFKDDSKGIGFKGSDDEWIKHYEGFENVLANLNKQENISFNASSNELPSHSPVTKTLLESSSKASKARVHYHKFTRGKDLSQCSEDDLGCIVGSKRAKKLNNVKPAEEDMTEPDDAIGTIEHSMGITTIKRCSIQEYFAEKMKSLRNGTRGQLQSQEGGNECASEENVGRAGFGDSCGDERDTINSPAAEEEMGKKKKKRKKQPVESQDMNTAEGEEINCIEEENVNVPKKKKKKKKIEGIHFNTVNGNDINAAASQEKSNYCIEGSENVLKKKKKKKRQEEIHFSAFISNVCEDNTVQSKKKHLHISSEEAVQCKPVGNEEQEKKNHNGAAVEEKGISDAAIEENPKKKRKKKKYITK